MNNRLNLEADEDTSGATPKISKLRLHSENNIWRAGAELAVKSMKAWIHFASCYCLCTDLFDESWQQTVSNSKLSKDERTQAIKCTATLTILSRITTRLAFFGNKITSLYFLWTFVWNVVITTKEMFELRPKRWSANHTKLLFMCESK